jgi:hypothetical protein
VFRAKKDFKNGIRVEKEQDFKKKESTLTHFKAEQEIKHLKLELRKALQNKLTDIEVRKFILGIRDCHFSHSPDWVTNTESYVHNFDDNIPCTIWSDWHWGEVVQPSQVFGLNEYNIEIAKKRAYALVDNTIWLLRNHLSKREYSGIVINLAGDMFSGDIHEELTETNAMPMMPLFMELLEVLTQCLSKMADEFGKVYVPCVPGNHPRTTKKKQAKNFAYKNFDWLLYNVLALQFKDDDRVTFLIGDDDEVQYSVKGHRYRLTHGCQFRGGAGFIGAMAPVIRGEHKKRISAGSYRMEYDTLLIGHFHQTMWLRKVICNGSLVGFNEYAIDGNFDFDYPKQMLWLTSPHLGAVSPLEVWCDKPSHSKVIPDQVLI